ncbi:MAG TPA: hypothetical protein EYP19_10120 [Desulfobacterales bacterium]|nr:hypothetical protein [Desulfobacterales bacterium]
MRLEFWQVRQRRGGEDEIIVLCSECSKKGSLGGLKIGEYEWVGDEIWFRISAREAERVMRRIMGYGLARVCNECGHSHEMS